MRRGIARVLVLSAAGLWLAGCSATGGVTNPFESKAPGTDAFAAVPPGEESAADIALPPITAKNPTEMALLGGDPTDDLSVGKRHYRAENYGLAEKYFRRAVELHPRDAEAWLGLAAAYDQLRRFDLADRAYAQAIAIVGHTPEILNNQGYSYMLRGDFKRARATLIAAQRKDPSNKYVLNNLQLLSEGARAGKAVQ
jgi:Flp pilus assembly protein TadD